MNHLKGTNWVNLELKQESLQAINQESVLFQIPFKKIVNSAVINKNDLQIEFPYEETKKEDDCLCEIRFFYPPQQNDDKNIEEEQTEAEKMRDLILSKAVIGDTGRESIANFQDIPLVVPRGKYACDFYDDFLRFHGQTHNYKIEYKNLERAFLLPKPDDVHMILVISLIQPLRQGNTVYPYLVIQIKKEIEEIIKLRLKPEQKVKYGESIKDEFQGPLYDIITKLFKIIAQTNIIIPGQFKSAGGHSGIRCSVKAQEGYLFPLTKSAIFVIKPVLYIRFEDIGLAIFHRMAAGNKLFDLELKRKSTTQSQIFTSIDKTEYNILTEFFKSKNIKIEVADEKAHMKNLQHLDDIDSKDLSEDSRSDVTFNFIETKKKRRQQKQNHNNINQDDDDDDDDESFNVDQSENSGDQSGESDIDDEDEI